MIYAVVYKVVEKSCIGLGSWLSSLQRQADQAVSTETSSQKRCTPSLRLSVDSSCLFDRKDVLDASCC
jgi:hypothetical protein